MEPMLNRYVSLSDGKVAGEPSFTGQQIVMMGVKMTGLQIMADKESAGLFVIQGAEVHGKGAGFCPLRALQQTMMQVATGGLSFIAGQRHVGEPLLAARRHRSQISQRMAGLFKA